MKKLLLLIIPLALLFTATAWAAPGVDKARLKHELRTWGLVGIGSDGRVLSIALPARTVSETVYSALMLNGLCPAAAAGRLKLPGIKLVLVLNRFGKQGYVFEGGTAECLKLPSDRAKARVRLLGMSRFY